ncbi:MAG: FKBP-type peptidyl-prolyl cis-trans isomerase, partial [Candidatus Symbiothrix sp.]|nr:FKBP-type peptidyl-prolyl cis-trans isomerase [Candidatus Symbiothrix sp.]
MKQSYILFFLSFITLSFTACNSDDDDTTTAWKHQNDAVYNAVKADTTWMPLPSDTIAGWPKGVYYKALPNSDDDDKGTEHPFHTANVTVIYKGYFVNNANDLEGTTTFAAEGKTTFLVGGFNRGFSIALQNMYIGDKWQICIPYYLGYGIARCGAIPADSTLFFDVEFIEIEHYPECNNVFSESV